MDKTLSVFSNFAQLVSPLSTCVETKLFLPLTTDPSSIMIYDTDNNLLPLKYNVEKDNKILVVKNNLKFAGDLLSEDNNTVTIKCNDRAIKIREYDYIERADETMSRISIIIPPSASSISIILNGISSQIVSTGIISDTHLNLISSASISNTTGSTITADLTVVTGDSMKNNQWMGVAKSYMRMAVAEEQQSTGYMKYKLGEKEIRDKDILQLAQYKHTIKKIYQHNFSTRDVLFGYEIEGRGYSPRMPVTLYDSDMLYIGETMLPEIREGDKIITPISHSTLLKLTSSVTHYTKEDKSIRYDFIANITNRDNKKSLLIMNYDIGERKIIATSAADYIYKNNIITWRIDISPEDTTQFNFWLELAGN